ncbi:DUF1990 family protein [Deinococcus hopiensis]|uniref:Uncharacterized protein, UPF0548 family n=1 Tax=Deinococcus hopiensis KR-140 TaxID=695939 RepID=A0A1W1VGX5_9DEIO|nr:DUF1990 family protein [Deinococcus hopiensis]SMB92639.1 Uncharacterized protein, UPF0548 family [Deinococcus hopiensis KR-140]
MPLFPVRPTPQGLETVAARRVLGHREACFARACAARLDAPRPWLRLDADGTGVGQTALLDAHLGPPTWTWMFGCRAVDVTERRLRHPAHPECGEERFRVELHADGHVTFSLRAYPHPRMGTVQPRATLAQRTGTNGYLQNIRRSTLLA